MSARIGWPAVVRQAGEIAGRRGHDLLIMLLVLLLGALAMIAVVAWMAEHLIVFAGVALLIGAAFHLGQRHERRRAASSRPGQGQVSGPAAAAAMMPTAALPQADYDWDELGTRQPASVQGGSDGDMLLADPLSGCRPLRRTS